MYKYRLSGDSLGDDLLLSCVDNSTNEVVYIDDIHFSILRRNRDMDLSSAKKLKYGKGFVSAVDKYHKMLSEGEPTFIYEIEHEDSYTVIVCIGYLKSIFYRVEKDLDYLKSEGRAKLILCDALDSLDKLYKKRYGGIYQVKRFTDNIALSEDFEMSAKSFSNFERLDWLASYLREHNLAMAVCKRGVLSLGAIGTALEKYVRDGGKGAFISLSMMGIELKELQRTSRDVELLHNILNVVDDIIPEEVEDETKRYLRLKKVSKLKGGSFDSVLYDEKGEVTLTEIQLGGAACRGYVSWDLEFDVANAKRLGRIIKIDESIELTGVLDDSSMRHCVVFVGGLVPVLISYIQTEELTDEQLCKKISTIVESSLIKKFEEKCKFSYRVFLELQSDFCEWLASNSSKCIPFTVNERVSAKRFEGVSPLVCNNGAVRATVLASWYNKRSKEYKEGILDKCAESPVFSLEDL